MRNWRGKASSRRMIRSSLRKRTRLHHDVPESTADETSIALQMHGVSKSFGGTRVLADVSLSIGRGEVHGLAGENGSGKSTLIKILSGYHVPDAGGSIYIAGRQLAEGSPDASRAAGCRFVHQELGLVAELPVLDNLALGAGYPCRWGTIREKLARKAVREQLRIRSQIDPETPVGELSAAERTGVAVVRAMQQADGDVTRVLVLDEPTATLPPAEVRRLLDLVLAVATRCRSPVCHPSNRRAVRDNGTGFGPEGWESRCDGANQSARSSGANPASCWA